MRISDWSSDVCSSDLAQAAREIVVTGLGHHVISQAGTVHCASLPGERCRLRGDRRPLPITRPLSGGWAAKSSECIINSNAYRPRLGISCGGAHAAESRGQINVIAFDIVFERSEERRVGKECVS